MEVSKIDLSKIPKNIEIDEDYLIKISAKLIESGELILSEKIMNLVSKEKRTESYLNLCLSFDYDNYSEYTFYLLNELLKVKNNEKNNFAPDFYRLLGRIGGNSIENNFAKNEIREYPEFFKPFAIDSYLIGLAENGKYYKTQTSVPDYYSKAKHLELYSKIIMVEVLKVSKKQASNSYQGNWNDGPFYNYATNFESILDTKIGGKSE